MSAVRPPDRGVFRTPERDAALDRLLAAAIGPETWRLASLRDHVDPDADLMFPAGPAEMIEAWFDLGDRRLLEHAVEVRIGEIPSLSRRIRALVLARIAIDRAHLVPTRRALTILALPGHGAVATRALARTVDTIWRSAGDRSADFSWYTKRASLAAIYAATVLYAIGDDRPDADVEAFLDRRLARAAAAGRRRRQAARPADMAGADQSNTGQRNTDQRDADQTDADQTDADHTDADQSDADQSDAGQRDATQRDADQRDAGHRGADQSNAGHRDADRPAAG